MKFYGSQRFANWTRVHAQGHAVGEDRPVGRVTVANNRIKRINGANPGPWRYLLFDQNRAEHEIPSIRSIDIQRSIGQDTATCTIVIANTRSHAGNDANLFEEVGEPGFYTFSRGETPSTSMGTSLNQHIKGSTLRVDGKPLGDWGYAQNFWHDRLIPNRLIRTYQGYGSENFDENGQMRDTSDPEYVAPKLDAKLGLTGTWLVDRVQISPTAGTITLECRDLSKLLTEQVIWPDLIPLSRFPLKYGPIVVTEHDEVTSGYIGGDTMDVGPHGGYGAPPGYLGDSNVVHGYSPTYHNHSVHHAFDESQADTYWLSVGNPNPNGFEYITGNASGDEINEVLVWALGASEQGNVVQPYTVYVSVWEDGQWQGDSTIPYTPGPGQPDNGAAIPYVFKTTLSSDTPKSQFSIDEHVLKLDRHYKATYIRVTFTNLMNHPMVSGEANPYRAGVRNLAARIHKQVVQEPAYTETNEGEPGVITDWSTAVKELLGWSGFTWLNGEGDEYYPPGPSVSDPVMGDSTSSGREGWKLNLWAEVQRLGAGPVEETPSDVFMHKTFMEGIHYIKDLLGAIFFIDEHGAAIFRMPNVFRMGNWAYNPTLLATDDPFYSPLRSDLLYERQLPIQFHDNVNIIDYTVTIDDSQLRSEVMAVAGEPNVNSGELISGAVDLTAEADASAINVRNILAGQERIFLIPAEHTKGFKNDNECQVMAELTAMFILFTYRKGQVTSIAHPGLQPDDQIRIFERQTNEYYVHYVSGVDTHMDLASGEYTMTVTTHWLGEAPTNNESSQWMPDFAPLNVSKDLISILEQAERSG